VVSAEADTAGGRYRFDTALAAFVKEEYEQVLGGDLVGRKKSMRRPCA
jgi:hypothetical protein